MWLNLAGGVLMLLTMLLLTPRLGIQGIAIAKLSYALMPLFLYIPLLPLLFTKPASRAAASSLQPVCEER
jgi:hypothetical protein